MCQALRSNIFLGGKTTLYWKARRGHHPGRARASSSPIASPRAASPRSAPAAAPAASENPSTRFLGLLQLKGIGKELFASLGGGENFIRSERKAFADGIEKQDRERGLL